MRHKALTERDLRALRIFRAVAHAKGISAAETQLCMTKATISRQIKAVEDSLGCKLCVRGPQGFELTPDGRIALKYAQDALDALDRIIPAVKSTREIISGTISIGLSDNVIGNPCSAIQKALDLLHREAPDVELSLKTMPTNALIHELLNRRIDIAIKGLHNSQQRLSTLRYQELFVETHKLYFSKKSTGASKGLGKHPCDLPLVFRAAQPFVDDAIVRLGYVRGPEAVGMESVAMLIGSTNYVGILPTHYAHMLSPFMNLEEVPNSPVYSVHICAVTDVSKPLSIAASKALELLEFSHSVE